MTSDATTAVDDKYFCPSPAVDFLEYRNAKTSVDVWMTNVNRHKYFRGIEIVWVTKRKAKMQIDRMWRKIEKMHQMYPIYPKTDFTGWNISQ